MAWAGSHPWGAIFRPTAGAARKHSWIRDAVFLGQLDQRRKRFRLKNGLQIETGGLDV